MDLKISHKAIALNNAIMHCYVNSYCYDSDVTGDNVIKCFGVLEVVLNKRKNAPQHSNGNNFIILSFP